MNDMPWIASYPAGVRWDADLEPAPVQRILDDAAAKWPDNPALEFMGKQHQLPRARRTDQSGRQGAAAARRQAGRARRAVPAEHAALRRSRFFGVLKAGGTVVNYSPLDAAKVLEHKVEDSRTDFLVTLDLAALYPQMAAMLGKTRLQEADRRQHGRDDARARRRATRR